MKENKETNYYQFRYTNFSGEGRIACVNATSEEAAIKTFEYRAVPGTIVLKYIDDEKVEERRG